MSVVRPKTDDNYHLLVLISLLSLAVFLTLFVLRALDDNRLTSWQWVFAGGDVFRLLFLLALGSAAAYVLTRVSIPGHSLPALLFLCSFAVGTLFWSEPEAIADAARYFTQAKHLEVYGIGYFLAEWGSEIKAWTDLPLVPLLYGLIFSLFGETRIYIQAFTTLLFSGTVFLTFLIGREFWDRTAGLLAGALLLGMPYLLTQVPLMLADVPTMFFLTLAVFSVVKAIDRGGTGPLVLSGTAVALAVLSKYSAWLMLTVLPVIVLARLSEGPNGPKTVLRRGLSILAVSLLIVVSLAALKFDVVSQQIGLLKTFQAPGLGRWTESFASTFFFQIHPFITLSALAAVAAAFIKKDLKFAIVAWPVLLVIVLGIRRARYIIPVLPMLALMAAYGLSQIKEAAVKRFAVASIAVSSIVIALFGYLPFLQNMSAANLRDAGRYLSAMDAERVEVIALPQARVSINPAVSVPLLDLFTDKKIVYRPGGPSAAPEDVSTSPLRFTWEYENPRYYAGRPDSWPSSAPALAVIAGDLDEVSLASISRKLEGYRLAGEFAVSDDVFAYRSLIRIYSPTQNTAHLGRDGNG
ncbi:MAG: glycosyltransferase family 39 protein [Nitrospirota bacterium]